MPEEEWARFEIYSSVLGEGDFARYIIGTNSGSFEWLSRRLGQPPRPSSQQIVRTFVRGLTTRQKGLWDSFRSVQGRLGSAQFSELLGLRESDQARAEREALERAVRKAKGSFARSLGKGKARSFREVVEPILNDPHRYDEVDRFDLQVAQRWILNRVFDLGWTPRLFGSFDRDVNQYAYRGREANKPERIGKKYQWIAYHEFLARVSDNFEFKG